MKQIYKILIFSAVGTLAGALLGYLGQCAGAT